MVDSNRHRRRKNNFEYGSCFHFFIRRPGRCRMRLSSVMVILIFSVTLSAASHVFPTKKLSRILQTIVYVDPMTGNLYNASLPDVDYSSFFDDDSISSDNPVTKMIQLSPFVITLELGSPSPESLNNVSSDLDQILERYLFHRVSNSTNDTSTFVSSLSLQLDPTVTRISRSVQRSSVQRATQSLSVSFQGNGNVTVVSPSNIFQTDQVMTQSINVAVESSFRDSSALLVYITSQASTAALKNVVRISTTMNGTEYSSPIVTAINGNNEVSSKRVVTQIFGYALVGVAGLSVFGWIYLLYLRFGSQKNECNLCQGSLVNRETAPKKIGTESFYRSPPSKGPQKKSRLSRSLETSHEEISDESDQDDGLLTECDDDDDSFAMRLRKAVLLDHQSHNQTSVQLPLQSSRVPEQSSKQIIPTLRSPNQGTDQFADTRSKAIRQMKECEIPYPVDLELQSDCSLSWRHQISPIEYPQFDPFDDLRSPKIDGWSATESYGTNAVKLVLKTRSSEDIDRSIPMEEYEAAVNVTARSMSQITNRNRSCESVHGRVANGKSNRDVLVSKLRSLIEKFDDVKMNEPNNVNRNSLSETIGNNRDCLSDNDTGRGTVSTDGLTLEDATKGRLGIHPVYTRDKTCRPPSSIVMKRPYVNTITSASSPPRNNPSTIVRPTSPIYAATPPHDRLPRPRSQAGPGVSYYQR